MSEWGVFIALGIILSFLIAMITPIIKLNTVIVKLTESMDTLKSALSDLTTNNSKSHDKLWKRIDEHDDQIGDHEARIQVMEKNRGDKR